MNRKGFTLMEIMIALVIASIVMAAIYSVYRAQTRQHRIQQMAVEVQQNMRAAMYLLEREIRMAGYSPSGPSAAAGFKADFSALGPPHDGSGAATDANNIAFTVDNDADGAISGATSFEIIAYRLDAANNELERWDAVSGAWQVAAEHITALSFSYHRADESQMLPPLSATDLADIRSVEVAIQATAGDRAMNMTDKIKCRNMGF
jgi:type IV pilus assembly protein PilW